MDLTGSFQMLHKKLFGSSSMDTDMDVHPVISQLQDSFLQNPVSLHIELEMVAAETDTSSTTNGLFSNEQLMRLVGNISGDAFETLNQRATAEETLTLTHIIVVVDRSSSMSGNPFTQMKLALEEIVGQSIGDSTKLLDIILYDSEATTIEYTDNNYKQVISGLVNRGATCFRAAFEKTIELMKHCKAEKLSIGRTTILFMTDGEDTVDRASKANEFSKKWAKNLKAQGHPVTVHCIGFSRGHDLKFLQRLCKAGNEEGLYRYCESNDGPEALKDKLEELFDFVNISDSCPVTFEVSLVSENNMLIIQGSQSGTFDGSSEMVDTENGQKEMALRGECWLYVKDSSFLPEMSVGLQLIISMKSVKYNIQVPCIIGDMKRSVLKDKGARALWDLSIISRNSDLLATRLADDLTNSKDVTKSKTQLEELQSKLSKTEVFSAGYDKETRAQSINYVVAIQAKVDRMHAMLAQYLRGETNSVSLLARAHDLRYEAKFSKSRRQRLMNRRVAKNFKTIKSDTEKAKVASEEDLTLLSSDALDFYHCILSMYSIKDILLDDTDLENALGIGLAVSRPEHVIDDPTSIRIFSISASLVCRSSIMDALEYKINTEGQLSAHGGFAFNGDIGYATVGAGREPINAWLPLYITAAHWERVKSCLRPSLGYLCTLDPLCYSNSQLDILFMVLGSMIGQLYKDNVGENQLRLIFSMQRTCHACIEEFHLMDKIVTLVQDFMKSPMGRFRHVLPNLYTVVGYLVSMPTTVAQQALGYSDVDNGTAALQHLWIALISEITRRASSTTQNFHENENQVTSLLNMLLHGQHSENSQPEVSQTLNFGHLCWSLSVNSRLDRTLTIPEYDPIQKVSVPVLTFRQSANLDKALALWAQARCGEITNKNRSEQVADAKKTVKAWADKLRGQVGLPPAKMKQKAEANSSGKVTEAPSCGAGFENSVRKKALEKAETFNTTEVNSSIVQVTAKLLSQLTAHAYPPLSCIPGCMGFLDYWMTSNHNWDEIKTNGEMVPQNWIAGVKLSVAKCFDKIEAFKKSCEEASQTENMKSAGGDRDKPDDNQHSGEKDANNQEVADYSDNEEEMDEALNAQLKRNRALRQQHVITIPMLIQALQPQGDTLELIRAMLCQAVSYPSNSQARDATSSGELSDLAVARSAHASLCGVEADLLTRKDSALKKLQEKRLLEVTNLCMLRTDSIWTFIGYLIFAHKERDEGFSALINSILECSGVQDFPLLAEKILVLLNGKHGKHVVFAKGNSWLPDKKLSKQLELILGEDAWNNIQRELMSNVHIHVYRESDKPNRLGHCNSNPYIPNNIREILKMPLIEENNLPRTSLKHHKPLNKKSRK